MKLYACATFPANNALKKWGFSKKCIFPYKASTSTKQLLLFASWWLLLTWASHFFRNIFLGWIQSKKNNVLSTTCMRSKVQYSRFSFIFIMVTFLQADVVFFKGWILNLKLQSYLNSLVYKYQKQYCVKICTVSIKDVTFLSKKLSWPLCLKVAPFLERKKVPLLSKKPSCHLWKEQHCLKERFYSPKLNQLHFWKLHYDLKICNNPFNHTISV